MSRWRIVLVEKAVSTTLSLSLSLVFLKGDYLVLYDE
jgi:hypothetical protein